MVGGPIDHQLGQQQTGQLTESRGTIPRFGTSIERQQLHHGGYVGGTHQQPLPNIHYVHSSFD